MSLYIVGDDIGGPSQRVIVESSDIGGPSHRLSKDSLFGFGAFTVRCWLGVGGAEVGGSRSVGGFGLEIVVVVGCGLVVVDVVTVFVATLFAV